MWQEVMKSKCGYCGFSGYQCLILKKVDTLLTL